MVMATHAKASDVILDNMESDAEENVRTPEKERITSTTRTMVTTHPSWQYYYHNESDRLIHIVTPTQYKEHEPTSL